MSILYEDRVNDLRMWFRNYLIFPPHFHDSFEIVYMLNGKTTVIVNGKDFQLEKGSFFISMPNSIHSFTNEEEIEAYLLIVPRHYAERFNKFLSTNSPKIPIINDDEKGSFKLLIQNLIAVNKSPHRFRKQLLEGYFTVFFSEAFSMMEFSASSGSPETERRILSYCLENFKENISLVKLSKILHISKNHISFVFSKKLRISLPEFLGSLRVAEAKRLLEAGASITEAAFDSGFSSIRTFNRHFLTFLRVNTQKDIIKTRLSHIALFFHMLKAEGFYERSFSLR